MKCFPGSKRGISLVEEICAVFILAITVAALIGTISLAKNSVLSDCTEDGASGRAQEITDALIAQLSKQSVLPDLTGLEKSEQAHCVGSETGSENNFSYSPGRERQFVCMPVQNADGTNDGYHIVTRVYYNNGKNFVQMKAYSNGTGDLYRPKT